MHVHSCMPRKGHSVVHFWDHPAYIYIFFLLLDSNTMVDFKITNIQKKTGYICRALESKNPGTLKISLNN